MNSNKPTVSLHIIVKDEYEQVCQLVGEAVDYFTHVYLTVSDKPTANKLAKIAKAVPNSVTVKYRAWTDRFDEARNANWELSDCDFKFWIDSDDKFDFSVIPQLVDIAVENNIDAIFLPYNYAQDAVGNCVARHWRERLIRNGKGFTWKGWIHETCITDEPFVSHKVDVEVLHQTSPEHAAESITRNHKILETAYRESDDPRYALYYGSSLFALKEYEECIEVLHEFLGRSGSQEDIYRALTLISETAFLMEEHETAIEYAHKAASLKPEYPMAYWLIAQYEADRNNWKEALEWIKVSETKPDPKTLSVWDPSARERAALIGAQCEFMLGHHNNAVAWLKKIPNNQDAKDLLDDFQAEANLETFIAILPKVRGYFKHDYALWDSLDDSVKYDQRLRALRESATEPVKWGDKSVVIFCGQGYEEWGPHTLDKGMGGSEEAVVYLSRELAQLGYDVVVYGETEYFDVLEPGNDWRQDEMVETFHTGERVWPTVTYRPWKEVDLRDTFNVFISWRNPQMLENVKARVKLADIHDVMPKESMVNYQDVTYLVKSQYHRDLYPELPDDKFVIIGNGIKKEQFEK